MLVDDQAHRNFRNFLNQKGGSFKICSSVGLGTYYNKYYKTPTHWVERLFSEHFYGAKLMRPFFLCCIEFWQLFLMLGQLIWEIFN